MPNDKHWLLAVALVDAFGERAGLYAIRCVSEAARAKDVDAAKAWGVTFALVEEIQGVRMATAH